MNKLNFDPKKGRFIKTHGLSDTKEWRIWKGLRERCYRKNHKNYKEYGGRGITVCERWNKFENFYADMGPRPTPKHSIDRINNDGPYSPYNCRWATHQEQIDNQDRTNWITYKNKTQTITQWADELGIHRHTLWQRIFKYKWKLKDAMERKKWLKKPIA